MGSGTDRDLTGLAPFALDRDAVTVEEGGEAIVLHRRSGEYYGLNETALFLWKQLQRGINPNEVLVAYCEKFRIDSTQAERDLRSFMLEISTTKLVTRHSSS